MNYVKSKNLTNEQIDARIAWLENKWDEICADLEESGGASGSPGEWIIEELEELMFEKSSRKV